MTEKHLLQLLKEAKDLPEFGGDFSVAKSDQLVSRFWSERGIPRTENVSYGWRDYAQYALWVLGNKTARPASVAFSVFLLVFGGWITSVNASFDSVPGDRLYPVKLATERVQVTFANSQRRAKLHAEFASRRLDEVVEITNSEREGKDVRVKQAVANFKKEVAKAQTELESIQTAQPEAVAEVVAILTRKSEEYGTTLDQTTSEMENDVSVAVADARGAVEEANVKTIETLVEVHEQNQEERTGQNLEHEFQTQMTNLRKRIATTLGRIQVISAVIADLDLETEYLERLDSARAALGGSDQKIGIAMDTLAAGGFRKAFSLLAEVNQSVKEAEGTLTQIEIDITLLQQERAAEQAEQEDGTPTEEGAQTEQLSYLPKF